MEQLTSWIKSRPFWSEGHSWRQRVLEEILKPKIASNNMDFLIMDVTYLLLFSLKGCSLNPMEEKVKSFKGVF
jgi:hypothetical protein